jgi:hypothetical protein
MVSHRVEGHAGCACSPRRRSASVNQPTVRDPRLEGQLRRTRMDSQSRPGAASCDWQLPGIPLGGHAQPVAAGHRVTNEFHGAVLTLVGMQGGVGNVCGSVARYRVQSNDAPDCRFVAMSHNWTVPRSVPTASSLPSGLKANWAGRSVISMGDPVSPFSLTRQRNSLRMT